MPQGRKERWNKILHGRFAEKKILGRVLAKNSFPEHYEVVHWCCTSIVDKALRIATNV